MHTLSCIKYIAQTQTGSCNNNFAAEEVNITITTKTSSSLTRSLNDRTHHIILIFLRVGMLSRALFIKCCNFLFGFFYQNLCATSVCVGGLEVTAETRCVLDAGPQSTDVRAEFLTASRRWRGMRTMNPPVASSRYFFSLTHSRAALLRAQWSVARAGLKRRTEYGG